MILMVLMVTALDVVIKVIEACVRGIIDTIPATLMSLHTPL